MQNEILKSLSKADFAAMAKYLEAVEVPVGRELYNVGDSVGWVYFPIRGMVSLFSESPPLDEVRTAFVGREGAVGLLEVVGSGLMVQRASVEVELRALRISRDPYVALFERSSLLRRRVASHVGLVMAESRQSMACQILHSVPDRLTSWLLEYQNKTGNSLIPLTQAHLATVLGAQRTVISTACVKLREEGMIGYSRGIIEIFDHAGLQERSCGCYRTNQRSSNLINSGAPPHARHVHE
jgi:CRP-like cAMP-binding protein